MFQGSGGRGWNALSRTQQIVIGIVGLVVVYALLSGGGSLGRMGDPLWLVAVAVIILVALPVHEMAHAAMAVQLGDETPRLQGRYTFNPIAHIDPFGALLILFTGFGWAKPVQWNPNNIDVDIRLGTILVAAAGPVSNLVLAAVGAFLVPFADFAMLERFLTFFVWINTLLFVFNLIPIPPLDGSHILFALLPGDNFELRMFLGRFGFIILIGTIYLGGGFITGLASQVVGWLFLIF
ncbi:MAG: site-2 protease family protein [Caldilineaceae bacterium]|nr:site-2 protease family protein [Caldilineaceae bacterium]